jgi:hypothetical protein
VNPYVFFVGCPRSGTTLMERLANAHPRLAVVHESRWIARTFQRGHGLTPEGIVTPGLLARLRDSRRLKPFELTEEELERLFPISGGVPFATFVTTLFDRYGDRQGKGIVGDKSPGYVRYLPLLHGLWPEAKFVHIIRDGRDVCLSVLDWRKGATRFSTFDDDPFTTTAVWWQWYVQLGREGGSHLRPELYHELRYESLVAEAEKECIRLCEFLEIPYDPAMLRFHEGRTRSKPGLSPKSAWLPVTGGLRDWRIQMDPADVVRFEAAAGDLLEQLGYPLAAPSIPRKDRARAASIRATFAEQLQARERPLPGDWAEADRKTIGAKGRGLIGPPVSEDPPPIPPRLVEQVAASAAGASVGDLGAEVELLRRKEHTSVLQYRFEGGPRLIAKHYARPEVGAASYEILRRLRETGFGPGSPYQVPEPLGWFPDRGVLVMPAATGDRLPTLADRPGRWEEGLGAAGRWLARLHALPTGLGPRVDLTEGKRRLAGRAAVARARHPDLVHRLIAELEQRAVTVAGPESWTQTHGRYHARHVFVASDAVTVIDLDRVAVSDPAKDLGEFLHRLHARSKRARPGDEPGNPAAHAFLKGYATHTRGIPLGLVYFWSYSILWTLLHVLELKPPKWERRLEFYLAEFETVPLRARSLGELSRHPRSATRSSRG